LLFGELDSKGVQLQLDLYAEASRVIGRINESLRDAAERYGATVVPLDFTGHDFAAATTRRENRGSCHRMSGFRWISTCAGEAPRMSVSSRRWKRVYHCPTAMATNSMMMEALSLLVPYSLAFISTTLSRMTFRI
jgi:hypothetical protein